MICPYALFWQKRACALFLLCVATANALPAQTFTTLVNFDGTANGSYPQSALVQATNGDFYGTTLQGGAYANCPGGCGTIFKITRLGKLTTLHSFCAVANCPDGDSPLSGLIQANDGNFYGTTVNGGASANCSSGVGFFGCGTVFKMTPGGKVTTLHSFDSTDGAFPISGLVQAPNGDFYGTTSEGGSSNDCNGYVGCGTVFKITPGGTLTTLHSFDSTDGAFPVGTLLHATNGDLYGTTEYGGANDVCGVNLIGCGTVFKITSTGTLTTLHNFDSTDGTFPVGALVQATNGDIYGTTSYGGANDACGVNPIGYGTVFKMTPNRTLTTLHSFDGADGQLPYAGLVQATNGLLYGTTFYEGGTNGYGEIYSISVSGTFTTVYSFGGINGAQPYAVLLQGTDGDFYGTTLYGGINGYGTIFSLSVGLGPFVTTLPTSGKVGAFVKILGSNLTGATSVIFNGTAATFTVVSSSLITTTVPAGATTGKVQVVTPSGTLSSNVRFRVMP
jgi:uncharacterized repeat protein (TIGR03803 family)